MNSKEGGTPLSILLADDDSDDRYLFYKALKEIPLATELRTVTNGDELMDFLNKNAVNLPDVLFLDLSMPRKTGFECLMEIKEDKKLEALPVVMFTTSFSRGAEIEQNLSNRLSGMGAQDYIRKPAGFENLKSTLHEALIRVIEKARLTAGK
ncbi:MAG: response regulator [Saprospiraceae bacterium]